MFRKVAFWLFLIPLAGCTEQVPDESTVESAVVQGLQNKTGGAFFELLNVEKTDGQASEINGVDSYRYFYHVTVVFPEGFRPECVEGNNQFSGMQRFNVERSCAMAFNRFDRDRLNPRLSDAVVKYSGEIQFDRTEESWLVRQFSINEAY